MPDVRIGVDIGGTFTDLVLVAGNRPALFRKVPSTPERPEEAVITGLRAILDEAACGPDAVAEVLHGTTVGSNTLLQKAGARCGLITTKGFRDVLEIGRVRTPGMFDLTWRKPEPLVRRRWRMEVDERMAADGTVLRALDPQEAVAAARFLVGEGVESIAICFLNSYANPSSEFAAAEAVRQAFPQIAISASVAVLPSMGEYERCSTAAVNAYVLPVLRGYIARLEAALAAMGIKAPLLIGNSNGGLSTAAVAQSKPVFFITSGRSSGAVGAARLGAGIGESDLIAFDMGGTTASATLIAGGEVSRTHEYEFRDGISTPSRFIKAGGYLMRVPTVDVAEVGSGAGSIAAIDEGGLLRVGPVSAGAVPGPACYGQGGERPTVTDANVVLGLLPPMLGGGAMPLDIEAARATIARHIAGPLGISVDAAAQGVRDVANTNMARAIRAVTVERGVDPRDFTLLAFGGSGPVHACDLAVMLGIRRVLFPVAPGVFTAAGMLAGRLEHHFMRPLLGRLDGLDPDAVRAAVESLSKEAEDAFRADGYANAALHHDFTIELRFQGQEAVVAVPLSTEAGAKELRTDFLSRYEAIYGYSSRDGIETAAIRLATSLAEGVVLDFAAMRGPAAEETVPGLRRAYFGGSAGWLDAAVLPRAACAGTMTGPLILESRDSTIVIPPSVSVETEAAGNLIATLPEAGQP